MLHPNSQPIKEPTNDTFQNPRAPTISEKDSEFVPVKHNFDFKIVRPKFSGVLKVPELDRRGKKKKDKDKKDITLEEERTNGCVNPEFMEKHNLGLHTNPEEYTS